MKRIIGLILILSLLLSLAACGGNKDATASDPTQMQPTATGATPTQDATEEGTQQEATEPEETEAEKTTEPEEEPAAYVTDSWVLVDNENVIFTVTKFEDNAHLGLQMHVYCENKTDKNMIFSLDGVSVCGVMYDPFWAEEVAAGKKVNSIISFDTFSLEKMGITSVDEISFRLSVIDADNWMDEPFADDHFSLYPTGKNAETVEYPEYRHKNGETVILENDQILFIVEKVEDTHTDFYTLNCYMANKTDKDLLISWDNVSVNGYMVDPFWGAAVGAGKQLYAQITFLTSDLEAQNIETVTDIAFTLTASDYNNFETVVEHSCEFQPK